MAKIIIFEQNILGINGVAEDLKQMCEFDENDIFVLSGDETNFKIIPLSTFGDKDVCQFKLINSDKNNSETAEKLYNSILDFMNYYSGENIVLMISLKLKSLRPSDNNLLACNIYAKLLMELNRDNQKEDLPRLSFLMYHFNGLETINKVCKSLRLIYESLGEEERLYFPKECCSPENISIIEGGVANWNCDFLGTEDEYTHLTMPDSYIEYIRSLNKEKGCSRKISK